MYLRRELKSSMTWRKGYLLENKFILNYSNKGHYGMLGVIKSRANPKSCLGPSDCFSHHPLITATVPIWICCCCLVTELCLTLLQPHRLYPPESSVHGILHVRILEWVAMPSSRSSSWPRDQTHISHISLIGRRVLYHWATWEAPNLL